MEYTFTDSHLAAECRREAGMRRGVYKKRIDAGSMTQEVADEHIAMMEHAAQRLDSLSQQAPSPRAVALRKAISESRARFSQDEIPLALVEAQSALLILLLKGSPKVAEVALNLAALAWRLSEGNTVVREMQVETHDDDDKKELIRLLNHPVITRREKTTGLLAINTATDELIQQLVAAHRKLINDREGLQVGVAGQPARLAS